MYTKLEIYNLRKFKGKKIKKIREKIEQLEYVENCLFEKEDSAYVLKVNYAFENENNVEKKIIQYSKTILNIIRKFESKAEFDIQEDEEIYRKVVYLKGLDCAHCAARIESIAKKQFNHEQIVVDFASTRFIIETTDKELAEDIVAEVTNVAHRVDPRIVVQDANVVKKEYQEEEKEKLDIPFIILSALGIIFFVIAVVLEWDTITNHEMKTTWFFEAYDWPGTICFLLAYGLLSYKVLTRFAKNIFKGQFLDENFLMTIASIGAIINSYYTEAIIIMVLFQIGEIIQDKAVNKSRKSISNLLKLDVKKAKIKVKGELVEVDVETVLPKDIISINKGEMIPLDGKLLSEHAVLDTKNITGESLHRDKKQNENVFAGSINMSDTIEIEVTKVYSDSMITKILDSVQNATSIKSKSEKFITKFSKFYTPIVVGIALLVAVIGFCICQFVLNEPKEALNWIYRGTVFLVISCPCALVISIPLSYFKGLGVASSRGILVKGSNYLEALSNVKKIVFDKTGTITTGEFSITEICLKKEDVTEKDLIKYIAYTEYYATHPIGNALVELYGRQNIFSEIISEFHDIQSRGCTAVINGNKYFVGSYTLMEENEIEVEKVDANGLVIYVARGKEYLGYIVVGDKIKDNAKYVMQNLRKQGIDNISIFTGDSKNIGEYVGKTLGVNNVYCNLLPDQKVEKLQELKETSSKNEKIAFVGDGLNDAPVIASADIGIALGATASDATIAISDIAVMDNNLAKVEEAIYIAKHTKRKVIQNIVFSLVVKIIIMILSLIPEFTLPVWLAVFGDVGVSLIAIGNSMLAMTRFKKEKKKNKLENKTNEK